MKIVVRLSVIVLLISLLSTGILGKEEFTIGVQNFEDYRPYSQVVNGEYTGFNREILDLFAQQRGYSFTYIIRPPARLVSELLNGKIDCIYPSNPYWAADIKKGYTITYSDPVVEYVDGVIVHKERAAYDIDSLKVLGTITGFTPFAYLTKITSGEIRLTENPSGESLLKQLLLKRIDGAYMNIAVSNVYREKMKNQGEELLFNPRLPYTKSYRSLSTIRYPEIVTEFNSFLKENASLVDSLKKVYEVEKGLDLLKSQ